MSRKKSLTQSPSQENRTFALLIIWFEDNLDWDYITHLIKPLHMQHCFVVITYAYWRCQFISLVFVRFGQSKTQTSHLTLFIYTERKKKRIFWLSKRRIHYKTNFLLIPAIYTHWYRRLNFSTNFFNFCWWRIPLAMTSLTHIGMHQLYAKETRARKQIIFEENGSLNNFPP